MHWLKNRMDTVIILSAMLLSVLWMNGKFNQIEKEVLLIKTILIMKEIVPTDFDYKHNSLERTENYREIL